MLHSTLITGSKLRMFNYSSRRVCPVYIFSYNCLYPFIIACMCMQIFPCTCALLCLFAGVGYEWWFVSLCVCVSACLCAYTALWLNFEHALTASFLSFMSNAGAWFPPHCWPNSPVLDVWHFLRHYLSICLDTWHQRQRSGNCYFQIALQIETEAWQQVRKEYKSKISCLHRLLICSLYWLLSF